MVWVCRRLVCVFSLLLNKATEYIWPIPIRNYNQLVNHMNLIRKPMNDKLVLIHNSSRQLGRQLLLDQLHSSGNNLLTICTYVEYLSANTWLRCYTINKAVCGLWYANTISTYIILSLSFYQLKRVAQMNDTLSSFITSPNTLSPFYENQRACCAAFYWQHY